MGGIAITVKNKPTFPKNRFSIKNYAEMEDARVLEKYLAIDKFSIREIVKFSDCYEMYFRDYMITDTYKKAKEFVKYNKDNYPVKMKQVNLFNNKTLREEIEHVFSNVIVVEMPIDEFYILKSQKIDVDLSNTISILEKPKKNNFKKHLTK